MQRTLVALDLDTWIRSLLATTSPLGTEAVIFKTVAEGLLPVELEEGVVD